MSRTILEQLKVKGDVAWVSLTCQLDRMEPQLFTYHWNDHVGQLAKIRTAAGLPEATRGRP